MRMYVAVQYVCDGVTHNLWLSVAKGQESDEAYEVIFMRERQLFFWKPLSLFLGQKSMSYWTG
jgi:hypothetical protein